MPSVSSSSSPSSATPSSATSKPAPTSPVVPIVVVVVLLVVLLGVMLLTFHFRRQSKKKILRAGSSQTRSRGEVGPGEIVSRTHPAALMITPADGKGTPRFVHTPGTNMRIATRRPDGAWEFADPRAPFTPSIIADGQDTADVASNLHTNRHSAGATPSDERASIAGAAAPSRSSDYSLHSQPQASYRSGASANGSSEVLLPHPPPSAASASPWGPPTAPLTADSDLSTRSASPWQPVYSPAPSTSASTFLPPPSATASSSRRNSAVSSNDSFLDLDPSPSGPASTSTHSHSQANPFLSPAPSPSPSARGPGPRTRPSSPLRTPSPPAPASLPAPRPRPVGGESRAAREIRLGYEALDRASQALSTQPPGTPAPSSSSASASTSRAQPTYEPPMTPAARAKEAESRAARLIRQGYESVDRSSEYHIEEGLPAY